MYSALRVIVRNILLMLFKITVGPYFILRYNVRLSYDAVGRIKGPCLLLANHVTGLDGMWLQQFIPRFIHFVVSDDITRFPVLSRLMPWLGFIPKLKSTGDVDTIRRIYQVAKAGGIVGIFPEGRRCWDGVTTPLVQSTAQLIKMLKIPVIAVQISGGYLTDPRWSRFKRRGRIDVVIRPLFSASDIQQMPVDAILKNMEHALHIDDVDWRIRNNIAFRGKNPAEYLERFLYLCPCCNSIASLESRGCRVCCTVCGADASLDEQGRIQSSRIGFDSVHSWGLWQRLHLRRMLRENGIRMPVKTAGAALSVAQGRNKYTDVITGELSLHLNRLEITSADGRALSFPIREISGECVYFKRGVLFMHHKKRYRLLFDNPRESAVKWTDGIVETKNLI